MTSSPEIKRYKNYLIIKQKLSEIGFLEWVTSISLHNPKNTNKIIFPELGRPESR